MHKGTLSTAKNLPLNRMVHALLLAAIVVCAANGQQTPTQSKEQPYGSGPASLPIAISRVEKGDFGPLDIEIIARWRGVQAIPSLKSQFERSKDPIIKGKIANALVRLGEKNGPYWDYLVDQARQVLLDGPPTPFAYDTSGRALTGASKKLIEWAKKHDMSVQQASNSAVFDDPAAIAELGSSDDKRAIPILRRALSSKNDFIIIAAAQGLAELNDTNSVPEIIDACENAPKENASLIARSLVYFNDPAAQHAVDEYVPKSTAHNLREAVAHGKTPYR